jgi:exonuclease III
MKVWLIGLFVLVASIAYGNDMRILTWNLQDAVPHSKAQFVADTAKEQKADIVALQDVNVTPYNLVNDLTEAFGPNWDYRVTNKKVGSKQLAIFWNTKTTHLKMTKVPKPGAYEETSIQVGERVNFPAQIAYLQKGMFDTFVINVNLIRGWEENEAKLSQAAALSHWVAVKKKALSGTENDFVVVGTFSSGFKGEQVDDNLMKNPATDELAGQNLLTFTMREVWKKNPSAFTYLGSWVDSFRLLDGFAMSKPAIRHYVPGSSQILRVDKKFKDLGEYNDKVSDHLPVIARFKTDFED